MYILLGHVIKMEPELGSPLRRREACHRPVLKRNRHQSLHEAIYVPQKKILNTVTCIFPVHTLMTTAN